MLPLVPLNQFGGAKWELWYPQTEVFLTPVPLCWRPCSYYHLQVVPAARHLRSPSHAFPGLISSLAPHSNHHIFPSSESQRDKSETSRSNTNQAPSTILGGGKVSFLKPLFPNLLQSRCHQRLVSKSLACTFLVCGARDHMVFSIWLPNGPLTPARSGLEEGEIRQCGSHEASLRRKGTDVTLPGVYREMLATAEAPDNKQINKQTNKSQFFGLLAKMLPEMAAYQQPVESIHGQCLSSNHAWELHVSIQAGTD